MMEGKSERKKLDRKKRNYVIEGGRKNARLRQNERRKERGRD